MACLNQEILCNIGKKLIENGSQKDVIKFALSGKESFQAMSKVFASVSSLKLYKNCYEIGWDKKYCTIYFNSANPKFLLHCIGNSVKTLHIGSIIPLYQPLLDKIISKKQLVSFSVNYGIKKSFLDKFLPKFSSSLKNVKIPCSQMTPTFRDTLNLESLTVLDSHGFKFAIFACKTMSLEIEEEEESSNSASEYDLVNPCLSSIKELTFNVTDFDFTDEKLDKIMKYFSSLESLKFIFTLEESSGVEPLTFITVCLLQLGMIVVDVLQGPLKITCSFQKSDKNIEFPDVSFMNNYLNEFEYDENVSDFYCFRKMIQISPGPTKTTLLEVQIAK